MRAHERLLESANPRNALLLFRIIFMDLFFTILLKLTAPQSLLRFLSVSAKKRVVNQDRVEKIVKYTDFIILRSIPPLKGACLKRSLLLYHFLRKEGLPVVINFGVAKDEGNLIGHSWLTLDGAPYYEKAGSADRFRCVLTHPLANADTPTDIVIGVGKSKNI